MRTGVHDTVLIGRQSLVVSVHDRGLVCLVFEANPKALTWLDSKARHTVALLDAEH